MGEDGHKHQAEWHDTMKSFGKFAENFSAAKTAKLAPKHQRYKTYYSAWDYIFTLGFWC
jgi:hypothetical protein